MDIKNETQKKEVGGGYSIDSSDTDGVYSPQKSGNSAALNDEKGELFFPSSPSKESYRPRSNRSARSQQKYDLTRDEDEGSTTGRRRELRKRRGSNTQDNRKQCYDGEGSDEQDETVVDSVPSSFRGIN